MTAAPGGGTRRVVLLHGLAGGPATWAPVAQRVGVHPAAGAPPVVAPALPWHSGADPSWAWDATDPGRVLDTLLADGDVVVAHSFAAVLLLARLCGDLPVRPAGVVLVSPFYRPDARDFRWSTLAHYLDDFHLLLAQGVRAVASRAIADDLLADMAVAVRDRVGAHGWVRFFTAYLGTPSLDVAALDVPLLVVHGQDDDVALPADGAALADRVPGARLVPVAGAGHFPMLTAPDAVADAVAALAARAWAPTPQEVLP
ncbi:alpha/beta fold hydrolase [Cellulomonas shaoxiangyii]|uniref:alpha/beta fold hydrolase n=1 Tax=Cellulomonas shaoxiangyii TaxID=2566013 RepID=UPI00140E4943|nr:alpha/beta hydrolase [Cellulomonas shaoxiangyii]